MDIATAAKRDEFLRKSFIMSIIRLLIKKRCKDNVFICHNQSKYTSGSHSAGAFQSMLYSSLKISFMRAQIIWHDIAIRISSKGILNIFLSKHISKLDTIFALLEAKHEFYFWKFHLNIREILTMNWTSKMGYKDQT